VPELDSCPHCRAWLWLLAFSEDRLMDCPVGGEVFSRTCDASVPIVPGHDEPADAPNLELSGEYWRHEVANRLQRYRARRRPPAPRYPSLSLPFDTPADRARLAGTEVGLSSSAFRSSAMPDAAYVTEVQTEPDARFADSVPPVPDEPLPYNNVIVFPRWAAVPVQGSNELAEPILDRPRIVEAPEVLPPPPAMGGILIDSAGERATQTNANSVLPLAVAPWGRRFLASLLNALILILALATVGGMFWWVNPEPPKLEVAIAAGLAATGLLWAAYEFLFIVYTGSTPGLRIAKLHLTRFDGSPVTRSLRRWRVLGSYLSAVSLGLGYLWSALDEDGLCWHDRMTHTHISLGAE